MEQQASHRCLIAGSVHVESLTTKSKSDWLAVHSNPDTIYSSNVCNISVKLALLVSCYCVVVTTHCWVYFHYISSRAIFNQYAVSQDIGLCIPSNVQCVGWRPGQVHCGEVQGSHSQHRWSSKMTCMQHYAWHQAKQVCKLRGLRFTH